MVFCFDFLVLIRGNVTSWSRGTLNRPHLNSEGVYFKNFSLKKSARLKDNTNAFNS